jgi:hypothetical protein
MTVFPRIAADIILAVRGDVGRGGVDIGNSVNGAAPPSRPVPLDRCYHEVDHCSLVISVDSHTGKG